MISPLRIAVQGVGIDPRAMASQGFTYNFVVAPEVFVSLGGFSDNRPRRQLPYYDQEIEEREVTQVLKVFLHLIS